MKKIYWRPRAISRPALALIALISLGGMCLVEHWPAVQQRPFYDEKLAAAARAAQGMEQICYARLRASIPIDAENDPTESGLIGVRMSPVTTLVGDLNAKQTSINPNFAAVVVDMLKRVGVKENDVVAVGCSGSFPALNLAAYAALETLKVKPIVILSAGASQFGANLPELLWLDMERILNEAGIISFHSVAVSYGGQGDRAEGMSQEGKKLIDAAVRRNPVPLLKADTYERSLEQRMELYRKHAGHKPIRAYINVGAGTVSVGRAMGKRMFRPGLNLRPPARVRHVDGVMPRFIRQGVPVIHLDEVRTLAEKYDLPLAPTSLPEVGQGTIYVGRTYHKGLAGGVLAGILAALYLFIRSDIGFRLLGAGSRRKEAGHPEPMV